MPNPAEDRQARLAKMQATQKNAERRRTLLVVGLAALVAAVLIGVVAFVIVQSESERRAVSDLAAGDIDGVETFEVPTQTHVETDVEYAQNPPVGGDHLPPPRWQDCGFYDAPVQDEAAVHSRGINVGVIDDSQLRKHAVSKPRVQHRSILFRYR